MPYYQNSTVREELRLITKIAYLYHKQHLKQSEIGTDVRFSISISRNRFNSKHISALYCGGKDVRTYKSLQR